MAERAEKGRGAQRFRKKDRVSRKNDVHRLDIFKKMVYNVKQYVIVWPGAPVRPFGGRFDLRDRAAVRS